MAEETRTQPDAGPEQSVPSTAGPATPGTRTPSTAGAPPQAATPQASPDFAAQLVALQQQNERYQSNIRGWEQEAKRVREENARLKQQFEAQQEQWRNLGTVLTGGAPGAAQGPKTPAEAMQKWLSDGDDTSLNNYFASQQQQTPDIVNQQLMSALSILQRQQLPFQMHPELADAKNPVRDAVFEAYEAIVADPSLRMLYPEDPAMTIQLPGPDGQQRTFDTRLLDRAALIAKSKSAAVQHAAQERERLQGGDAMFTTGGAAQASQLEPTELFTPSELAQFADPAVTRALPKDVEKTPKGIAKWLVEKMPDGEKQKRLQAYRARKVASGA